MNKLSIAIAALAVAGCGTYPEKTEEDQLREELTDLKLNGADLMKRYHASGKITEIHGRLVRGHRSNGPLDGLTHSERSQ